MTRHVPHQNSFDRANRFEKWQTIILVGATLFTILSIALNAIDKTNSTLPIEKLITYANAISSLLAVLYIVTDIRINDLFYAGGKEKRTDLIDHAFGVNFSGGKSTGYFNADGVPIGVYKLAVLGFENSLFTSQIAKRMTAFKWPVAVIITGIFIFSACIGNKDLVNNILQIAATGVLIQQAIRLQQFSNRMNNIHSDFKKLFNDLKGVSDKTPKEGEIIQNVLNYEATLSWGSILLDSSVFDKLNPELSNKWEEMKRDYQV